MSMQSEKEKILELEKKAEELQQQQKLGDTLNILEQILNLKREVYGEDSEQYSKTSEKLCEICNIIAMICLNKDKNDSCYDFLKKAEILSQSSALYKAITYNNMAQYCKKTNKIKAGIKYLEKAQDIQLKQGNPVLLADTHLNLCALLSRVDRHNEALEHILIAVVLLQDEYTNILLRKINKDNNNSQNNTTSNNNNNNQTQDNINNNKSNQEEENEQNEANLDLYSKLSIAYHNMGVEFEFLKRYDESLQTYEKAVNFARLNLGVQHELVKQFDSVFQSAQQSIADQRHKEIIRKKQPSNNNINHQHHLKLSQVNTVYNITTTEKSFPLTAKNSTQFGGNTTHRQTSSNNLYNVPQTTKSNGSVTAYGQLHNFNKNNKKQQNTTDGFTFENKNNKINSNHKQNHSNSTLPQIVQPKQQQQKNQLNQESQNENKSNPVIQLHQRGLSFTSPENTKENHSNQQQQPIDEHINQNDTTHQQQPSSQQQSQTQLVKDGGS